MSRACCISPRFSPRTWYCNATKPIAVFGALAADCAGMEVVAEIHDFDGSLIAQEHAYSSQNVVNGFSQWRVMLPAQPEGGPYTLRIVAGNDAIEFDDVLIGEVWLAGGQSNMELELRNSEHADEALEDWRRSAAAFLQCAQNRCHQSQGRKIRRVGRNRRRKTVA